MRMRKAPRGEKDTGLGNFLARVQLKNGILRVETHPFDICVIKPGISYIDSFLGFRFTVRKYHIRTAFLCNDSVNFFFSRFGHKLLKNVTPCYPLLLIGGRGIIWNKIHIGTQNFFTANCLVAECARQSVGKTMPVIPKENIDSATVLP